MEKIIDLAEDNTMALKRLRELVTAAVQKFNEGSLAAAVWMLDVAEDTITERKLDIAPVDQIRAEAAEAINQVQLRKYAENKIKHAALKIALGVLPDAAPRQALPAAARRSARRAPPRAPRLPRGVRRRTPAKRRSPSSNRSCSGPTSTRTTSATSSISCTASRATRPTASTASSKRLVERPRAGRTSTSSRKRPPPSARSAPRRR